MKPSRRTSWLGIAVPMVAWAAMNACSLNPQPLPPDTADGGLGGANPSPGMDSGSLQTDTDGSGEKSPDGSNRDGEPTIPPDGSADGGSSLDGASEGSTDAPTDAPGDAPFDSPSDTGPLDSGEVG